MSMMIDVRGFKWPKRPTGSALARLLGEDSFGHWLGILPGDSWWQADGSAGGTFTQPFVKLVPRNTFWSACFNTVDPIVDVDIILPVQWFDRVLEEVDLELDILRTADGQVRVRDQDLFDQVRVEWNMPAAIALQAETTCALIRKQVERGNEPFGSIGQQWLARLVADTA